MIHILHGDCRAILPTLPDSIFQTCVTSPPYFKLRSYLPAGHPDKHLEIGCEQSPVEYVATLAVVFREIRRTLRDDGVMFITIGDSYDNNRSLLGIPLLLALALRDDGWYWRDLIVWAKPNGMPGSQTDRCTSSHETILFMSKSARYYSDFDAIKTPPRESSLVRLAQDVQAQSGSHRANGGAKTNGPMKDVAARNDKPRGHARRHAGFNDRWDAMSKDEQQAAPAMMRNVWFVSPSGYSGAHFATMPPDLAERCIKAGSKPGDAVLDPFGGAGTTGLVADRLGRHATLIELNPAYRALAANRITDDAPLLAGVA